MAGSTEQGAVLREEGKLRYFQANADAETKNAGLQQLKEASRLGDPEAMYILGELMLLGCAAPTGTDRVETAMRYITAASTHGLPQARALLNHLCQRRYMNMIRYAQSAPAPLKGFDGKRIRIDSKGPFVPVDAKLSFDGQENLLTLSANIHFLFADESEAEQQAISAAVLQGFRDWEGLYEVFGGQKLRIRMDLTTEARWSDSVHVIPLAGGLDGPTRAMVDRLARGKRREKILSMTEHRRSFAALGLGKWSVHSTKLILLQGPSGSFDDPDELRHIAKHEFGHVLGLGDMYPSEVDALPGVEPGKYEDVECFRLFDRYYRMVMCDHTAPISGNDIEMVVLAFSKNRYQRFQPEGKKKNVSEALGKGN